MKKILTPEEIKSQAESSAHIAHLDASTHRQSAQFGDDRGYRIGLICTCQDRLGRH